LILFSVLAASRHSLAFVWVPVHGCLWLTGTDAITNFTLFNGAPDNNRSSSVHWQVPMFELDCAVTNTSSIPPINKTTVVPCTSPHSELTNGQFRVLEENGLEKSAALIFVAYEGCASNVYTFYYRADFVVKC
ncbi:hypothetical protein DE146DRAFT_598697, partial [Phaeosphaeria sp. MPI-PUGE-AT-0046c]